MAAADALKIISVTGAHSGVGKTSLCSILLENLKGFGAVKCTKTSLFTSVTDDEERLLQPGKDTAVYLSSGAEKVVWIQSPGGKGLEEALAAALTNMQGLKGVVIEGNSPLDFLEPALVIFIVQEDGRIKPSALNTVKKADVIIINSDQASMDEIFSAEILLKNIKVFRIDLIHNEGEIDKFLAYIKEYMKLTEDTKEGGVSFCS